jgi:hypothetical protein
LWEKMPWPWSNSLELLQIIYGNAIEMTSKDLGKERTLLLYGNGTVHHMTVETKWLLSQNETLEKSSCLK